MRDSDNNVTAPILNVLTLHGFYLPELRNLGHGVASWVSKDFSYSVEVEIQESEPFSPYNITILRRTEDEALLGSFLYFGCYDFEAIASCDLDANFVIQSAHIHNESTDTEGFVAYLSEVLNSIDGEPVLRSEFDLDDDSELFDFDFDGNPDD